MEENLKKYLPQVDQLIKRAEKEGFGDQEPWLKEALKNLIEKQRKAIFSGSFNEEEDLFSAKSFKKNLSEELIRLKTPPFKRVINATGTVIHTNLGRSPLSREIIREIEPYLCGYSTLEFDLKSGKRGSRQENIKSNIFDKRRFLVVNNNASACLLVLSTLAKGREVIVSRGELVEIGGSFRIPEVMELSGCFLKEVGTTNKTKIQDYEKAITDNTALILKVHRSNFRLEGFVEDPETGKLLELAKRYGIPFYYDIGSGALPLIKKFDSQEPVINDFKDDNTILSFSTDKLLGGCQGGVILASDDYLEKMKKHPLYRAIRPDKFTIYYLERLFFHISGGNYDYVPVLRIILQSQEEIKRKAQYIYGALKKLAGNKLFIEVARDNSAFGGGSLPAKQLPTYVIRFRTEILKDEEIRRHFLDQNPAVIIRQKEGFNIIDLRTVERVELKDLIKAFDQLVGKIS